MSTGFRPWHLRRDRLAVAMALWLSLDPSPKDKDLVHGFLMDLVVDPLACGVQEGDTGIFVGRPGRGIVVLYVPDLEEREVSVALISYDPKDFSGQL